MPNIVVILATPQDRFKHPHIRLLVNVMLFFKCIAILTAAVSATFAQTIQLGFPQNGNTFSPGQKVTAQVILPVGSYVHFSI
jgi:hypothetical protein